MAALNVPSLSRCAVVAKQIAALRQLRHDRAPLGVRVARPVRNFIERAITTDAKTRVGIDRADFYAGGFDGLENRGHCEIISSEGCKRAHSALVR